MRTSTHRKLVITSLALLTGATLATSVTSTVAWFQYSTRATVAYTGTSAHCSKLLEISVDDGQHWGNRIGSESFQEVKFAPITSGELAKDAPLTEKPPRTVITGYEDDGVTPITEEVTSLFYAQPDYRQGEYDNWFLANSSTYLQFDILVRVKDINENTSSNPDFLANDVYLTDLTILDASNATLDLSNAVRIHFATEYKEDGVVKNKNFLFAKEDTSCAVGGFLDMNNDGILDRHGYEWDQSPVMYGGGTCTPITEIDPETGEEVIVDYDVDPLMQTSYASNDPEIIANETNNIISGGTSFGSTGNTQGDYLKITVTIWLEGWAGLLNGEAGNYHEQDSSVWDSDSYAAKSFNIGMTFGVNLHSSEE